MLCLGKWRVDQRHPSSRRNQPLLPWHCLLLFALLGLLVPISVHAQELGPTTWKWRTFTAEDSPLAPGRVNVLLEDSQGGIWIGTSGGLSLYQVGAGQTFTTENPLLALGWVSVLLEDSQGRIWIGTSEGLSLYQAEAWHAFTAENSLVARARSSIC